MVEICYTGGAGHSLEIRGHAGYNPNGYDIVCAGVSAITCTLLAYLGDFGARGMASNGLCSLYCNAGPKADTAIAMALTGYRLLAGRYPHHVKLITTAQKPEDSRVIPRESEDVTYEKTQERNGTPVAGSASRTGGRESGACRSRTAEGV